MPDDSPIDPHVIKAPGLDGAQNPPVRGVAGAGKPGVVGVDHDRASLGQLGGSDRVFRQSAGVYGESAQQGVFGHSTSTSGTGVYGNSEGAGFGVRGDSTDGVAVQGQSFGSGPAGRFLGRVEVQGDATFTGNVHVTGDIQLVNADCAEDFDIHPEGDVEPGTVMVIDGDSLRSSDRSYDKRVAGVVSGAGTYEPALVLDRQSTTRRRLPIALMGKVYCKVDAQFGPIEVGDLLTTSPTDGHAMKAIDPTAGFGAIIGKALRPLPTGQGMIPILVSLQ
jgi:hypothetical protein